MLHYDSGPDGAHLVQGTMRWNANSVTEVSEFLTQRRQRKRERYGIPPRPGIFLAMSDTKPAPGWPKVKVECPARRHAAGLKD